MRAAQKRLDVLTIGGGSARAGGGGGGNQKESYTPPPPETYKNGEKMGPILHFLAYKSLKTLLSLKST